MISNTKISIIGAGHVGATTAMRVLEKGFAKTVVLVDIVEGLPQGKALDEMEAAPIEGFDGELIGTNNYSDTADSDIVVITSGLPRKPGMSRDDLLEKNVKIVKSVTKQVAKYSPNAILIIVTNPLDAMVYTAKKVSGFPDNHIMGMAGCLDSARFSRFIAWEAGCSVKNVNAFVLGGHGDNMVPLARYSTVSGVPITKMFANDRVESMIDRTRKGGGEIVKLLKTGSAYFAPSSSVCKMIKAITSDSKEIMPIAAALHGEYGVNGVFVGAPAKLGKSGVEEIVEFDLTDEEKALFKASADHVKELCAKVDGLKLF